jgi:hypothetical protein
VTEKVAVEVEDMEKYDKGKMIDKNSWSSIEIFSDYKDQKMENNN